MVDIFCSSLLAAGVGNGKLLEDLVGVDEIDFGDVKGGGLMYLGICVRVVVLVVKLWELQA